MAILSRKNVLSIAIASIAGTGASLSYANEANTSPSLMLEEVIVTARKREESLIDVPMSISAVSGEDIAKMNAADLEDIQDALPNLTVVSAVGTQPLAYIRGQGTSNNVGFEQSVGWFVDGIYGSRGEQFRNPTFDITSIELLRGPQGTVLGKNIIAGAINIRTARPTDEPEGRLSVTHTNRTQEQRYEAVISGPLSDTIRGRLALMHRVEEGWIRNTAPAAANFGDTLDDTDDDIYRLSLEWDISDNLSAYFKAEGASTDIIGYQTGQMFILPTGPTAGFFAAEDLEVDGRSNQIVPCSAANPMIDSLSGSCAVRQGEVPYREFDGENYVAEFVYNTDNYTITALSGWSEFDGDWMLNAINSGLPLIDANQIQEFEQFSQELRISSPGGETIDWTAGLYYQDNDFNSRYGNLVTLPFVAAPTGLAAEITRFFEQQSETRSAFAEVTYNASEQLSFTLGSRWTQEDKSFDKRSAAVDPRTGLPFAETADLLAAGDLEGVTWLNTIDFLAGADWTETGEPNVSNSTIFTSGDREENETTFSGIVQYDMGDNQIYFSISEGFKAGGFNEDERLLVTTQFEPEEALAYELGAKFVLDDGAAQLNIALFHVQYENLQISIFDGTAYFVGNAGESISQGIEVDGRWRLTEALTLSGAFAYLDAYYEEYVGECSVFDDQRLAEDLADGTFDGDIAGSRVSPVGTGECQKDYKDLTTRYAPEWSGNFNIDYATPITEQLMFTGRLGVSYRSEAFTQADLDPNDVSDSYTVLDARLAVGAEDQTWEVALVGRNLTDEEYKIFSADTPNFAGGHGGAPNRPRTLSLQASYRF